MTSRRNEIHYERKIIERKKEQQKVLRKLKRGMEKRAIEYGIKGR